MSTDHTPVVPPYSERPGQRPGERYVGTIDVADPADVETARDKGWRIDWAGIFDAGSGSVAEPCHARCFVLENPCDDCGERPATETWDYSDAPIPNPPPADHLCEGCADTRRDRDAERAAEDAC